MLFEISEAGDAFRAAVVAGMVCAQRSRIAQQPALSSIYELADIFGIFGLSSAALPLARRRHFWRSMVTWSFLLLLFHLQIYDYILPRDMRDLPVVARHCPDSITALPLGALRLPTLVGS